MTPPSCSRSNTSTYQVLLALGDGEAMHGYAIMQAVSAMTEGCEAILPGTLYAALARMVDEGLVTESTPKGHASGGPARRYHQRTSFGRAVARAESERLRAVPIEGGERIVALENFDIDANREMRRSMHDLLSGSAR